MINILGISIHLYGILIGLGVWIGLEIALVSRPKLTKELEESFVWALLTGVVGARLYHVVDYWNRYYSANFWKIFAVWEGGLGIWGAIVGAILGLGVYSKLKNKNIFPLMDAFVIGAPIAQAVGRIGNWVNGELVGRNGQPLFAYEAGLNILLFIFLVYIDRLPHPPGRVRNDGRLIGVYLIGYGVIRILLEGIRPDNIIWRIGGIPTAIIFGAISGLIGLYLVLKEF